MQTEYSFLDSVSTRLSRIANRYSTPEVEPDDLYQTMVTGLLEKANNDPAFPQQSQSYICQSAAFKALHEIRANRIYRNYCQSVTSKPNTGNDDGQAVYIDSFASPTLDPERAIEQAEEAFLILDTLRQLTGQQQTIVKMVYLGLRNHEIAARLHVSRSYISRTRKQIARTVKAVLS